MWQSINTVIHYFINKNFKYKSTIAIFNFMGTLICHPPWNMYNLKIKHFKMADILYDIHNKGTSIIIFQSFPENTDLNVPKKMCEKFLLLEKISEIPFLIFFTVGEHKFMKPYTGMMTIINNIYKEKKKSIDLKMSAVIGHKNGRINSAYNNVYSSADRAFAHNIKTNFIDSNFFFGKKEKKILWSWDKNIISVEQRRRMIKNPEEEKDLITPFKKFLHDTKIKNIQNGKMKGTSNILVCIIGPPSCGKKTLMRKLHATINSIGIKIKIIDSLSNYNSEIKKSNLIFTNLDSNLSEILMLKNIFFIKIIADIRICRLLNCVNIQKK